MRERPSAQANPPSPSAVIRHATWPWAVGSVLAVVVLLGGTFAAHTLVSHARKAALSVSAPAVPPMAVAAVARPEAGATLLADDAAAGHLVTLAVPSTAVCPPVGSCPTAAAPDALVVLDGATGATLARTPLTGDAAAATASNVLLIDASRHLAYAVGPRAVTLFSTETGAYVGGYALLLDSTWSRITGAALDTHGQHLLLLGGDQLIALDAPTGTILAQQTIAGIGARSAVDGPVLDGQQGGVFVLVAQTDGAPSTLQRFTLASGAQAFAPGGSFTAATGTRLGPIDSAGQRLYLFEKGAAVASVALADLAASSATPQLAQIETPEPALRGAVALGWDGTSSGSILVAGPHDVTLRDAHRGTSRAMVPLPDVQTPFAPVPGDSASGMAYLLSTGGEIVLVRPATAGLRQSMTPATGLVLAHAAMGRFLPPTNQNPPFISPAIFPLVPGTVSHAYYIHFSDLGWQGPFRGSASSDVTAATTPGAAYTATFRIGWTEIFARTHTWICDVFPDGSVHLRTDTGDALP